MRCLLYSSSLALLFAMCLTGSSAMESQPVFLDLRAPAVASQVRPLNDIAEIRSTEEGIAITPDGNDPYLALPPLDLPDSCDLWCEVVVMAGETGRGEFFWFNEFKPTSPEDSVGFSAREGEWMRILVPLPPLGKGCQLRIDPPGTTGTTILQSLSFTPRKRLSEPVWPPPCGLRKPSLAGEVTSGSLTLRHRSAFGDFSILIDGAPYAEGGSSFMIGYQFKDQPCWLEIPKSGTCTVSSVSEPNGLVSDLTILDEDGATWHFSQEFVTGARPGAIDFELKVTVSQTREVTYLPLFLLFPGAGSFGASKQQALLAGVEYLADEPSSSTADLIGPEANRRVCAHHKLTFPLMAITAQDKYLGVMWDRDPRIASLFDTPDRTFGSGGHLFGLQYPGCDGLIREEGALMPYFPSMLPAGEELVVTGSIVAGKGKTVVPAVQDYVELAGLPALPEAGLSLQEFLDLMATGWLDSEIRKGTGFCHSYVNADAHYRPIAEAAMWMQWLAAHLHDAETSSRLEELVDEVLAQIRVEEYGLSFISHIPTPAMPFLGNFLPDSVDAMPLHLKHALSAFRPDGTVAYQRAPDRPDFQKTYWQDHVNGLTADRLRHAYRMAWLANDPEQRSTMLDLTDKLDQYRDQVPRGAQSWEIALHTPDIMASGVFVKVLVSAYEWTGDPKYLEQARYWAWTGVPFVYLTDPTGEPIGLYATTPVLGATHWIAPVWIGLPVQWCGLVYAEALYDLFRIDPNPLWKQLADGIVVSGIQQTYPQDHPRYPGLLPDSLTLISQVRNLAAINPGTLLANAQHLYEPLVPAHSQRFLRTTGVALHAPGELTVIEENDDEAVVEIRPWPRGAWQFMAAGVKTCPSRVVIEYPNPPYSSGAEQLTTEKVEQAYAAESQNFILDFEGTADLQLVRLRITW